MTAACCPYSFLKDCACVPAKLCCPTSNTSLLAASCFFDSQRKRSRAGCVPPETESRSCTLQAHGSIGIIAFWHTPAGDEQVLAIAFAAKPQPRHSTAALADQHEQGRACWPALALAGGAACAKADSGSSGPSASAMDPAAQAPRRASSTRAWKGGQTPGATDPRTRLLHAHPAVIAM